MRGMHILRIRLTYSPRTFRLMIPRQNELGLPSLGLPCTSPKSQPDASVVRHGTEHFL